MHNCLFCTEGRRSPWRTACFGAALALAVMVAPAEAGLPSYGLNVGRTTPDQAVKDDFMSSFGLAKLNVEKFTLENGLTVLFVPRHDVPVFTGYILAKTGSVNEHPGVTGVSHLLEHMMFKGTQLVGTLNYEAERPVLAKIDELAAQMKAEQAKLRTAYTGGDEARVKALRQQIADLEQGLVPLAVPNELWNTYEAHGGSGLNASTGNDSTQFYVSLPSNKFELWAFLESDRLRNPVFRAFYSERDVVREERRLRTESDPVGTLREQFGAVLNLGSFYSSPIVGWPCDLDTMTRPAVLAHFRQHYAPNNLVMAIVGDLQSDQVHSLVERYFGPLEYQEPPEPVFAKTYEPCGEKRVEVLAESKPYIFMGYPGPLPGSDDQYALDMLCMILGRGNTSRLYRSLVETGLAISSSSWNTTRAWDNIFTVYALPQADHSMEEVEAAVDREIARLQEEEPQEWEMEKSRVAFQLDFVATLEKSSWLAGALARSEAFNGGWENLDENAHYSKVTAADVRRVARQYLVKERRTLACLRPKTGE